MYLENGRDIFRSILILAFAAVAYWVDLTTGLVLVTLIGLLILQSAFTGWCPADLILRPGRRMLENDKIPNLTSSSQKRAESRPSGARFVGRRPG
jgi:hypothetical protein